MVYVECVVCGVWCVVFGVCGVMTRQVPAHVHVLVVLNGHNHYRP